MRTAKDTYVLSNRADSRGLDLSLDDLNILRRAEKTLSRWSEQECGDGNDRASWAIERDEETGIPYRVVYPHQGKSYRNRTPDLEAGALRRVKEVCERNGLHWYHQTDPRGCALYVSKEPLTNRNYNYGMSCSV